jgi:DmsE family decaheme c-type cytochrome
MSIIQIITVVGNLAIGLWSAPAPPTAGAGNPSLSIVPSTPIAAHVVAKVALALPADDVTKETCASCHEEQVASFDRSEHNRAMAGSAAECSSCHGDATAHIEAGGGAETMVNPKTELATQVANKVCMTCHEKTGEQLHANMSEHTRAGVGCVDCHNVHPGAKEALASQKEGHGSMIPAGTDACIKCHSQVAAEFAMPSRHRLQEGAMNCSSCHNVHGTSNGRQVREEGKEMCATCHKDKAQAFAFEHEAGAIDGCTACHTPHGSAGQHMLKERDPRALCTSCHSRDMGKGAPHGRASTTTMGDCTRCHTAIHGSNLDPYLLH